MSTVEEVKRSKIGVYIVKEAIPLIPEEFQLHDSYVVGTNEKLIEMLFSLDKSVAYVLTDVTVNKFIRWVKSYQQTVPFYVIKEPLLLGYDVYIFQKHSPFVKKINQLVLREKEGILAKNHDAYRKIYPRNGTDDNRFVVLTMSHISSIFYMLVGGLATSCLIFIIELYSKKWTNKK
jgi:uncharacterized membrane protein